MMGLISLPSGEKEIQHTVYETEHPQEASDRV